MRIRVALRAVGTFDRAGAEMLACPLPPRHDPDAHRAVDEARGLRAAYDRGVEMSGGRFGAGRVGDAPQPMWFHLTPGMRRRAVGSTGNRP